MALEFIDTSVFIRYITDDNPEQSSRSLAFLQEVEAARQAVTTCEGVLVEVVQVLESKRLYNFPRVEIQAALADILELRGFQLADKPTYLRALELYASSRLDFVDALNVAHMEHRGIQTIVSFDQDLDRTGAIARREP